MFVWMVFEVLAYKQSKSLCGYTKVALDVA